MKTGGGSKRKLPERKDPGAGVGLLHRAGLPGRRHADHLRDPANGRPAEMPLDEALASASIPQFRWPGTRMEAGGSGPVQGDRAPGAA